MMKPRCSAGIAEDEMMELRKVWTAVMMEKCRFKNEAVACPKPRRWHAQQSVMEIDLKLAVELSDILSDKASPPYYAGSPPIRSSNPFIQDAYFQEQRVSESIRLLCVGLDCVNRKHRAQSVLMKALNLSVAGIVLFNH